MLLDQIFEDSLMKVDDISSANLYDHPFKMIAEVKSSSLHDVIFFQAKDKEFVTEFFNFFIDKILQRDDQVDELTKYFFIGRVRAVTMWIQRTKQNYDIFKDYDELDRIFESGK
ncbi:hypothetical protein NBRC111893_2177 [Lentilactobacillus kosonis]|uniref:Uncharacterized protein n=2 Tax=Lentilactobacillus kosonis TaxID=2810561 RepID=A0A401FP83_9LACO|nr:hypothetical protein NBRC111893_2177 [Lentilactobacillus kosonis]